MVALDAYPACSDLHLTGMETSPAEKRVHDIAAARAQYGSLVARMVHFLDVGDPIADELLDATRHWPRVRLFRRVDEAIRGGEVAPELEPLIEQIRTVPAWVDFDQLDRGARFFMSSHALGGMVLGARSLVLGYASPAGNKPLVLSGRLEKGVNRRLAETSKFVYEVCKPGGMRPMRGGVVAAVQVRLIHAKVRQMIREKCDWNPEWGVPINQHDMLATVHLFGLVLVQGLEILGVEPTPEEAEDYIALWRYIGWILGVDPELLPATRAEAERTYGFIELTQGEPDDDARKLTEVFLNAPAEAPEEGDHGSAARPNVAVGYALARELLGDERADQLAIPKTPLRMALPLLRAFVGRVNRLRRRDRGQALAAEYGQRYWEWVLESQPSGAIELSLPTDLLRSALDDRAAG
jgi:hypothetical protein